MRHSDKLKSVIRFKPYYKWNTFNTMKKQNNNFLYAGFKPYYKWNTFNTFIIVTWLISCVSFKPYYKWNTFNTAIAKDMAQMGFEF